MMSSTETALTRPLASLDILPIWCGWRHEAGRKPPISVRTGRKCATADRNHLGTRDEAQAVADRIGGGIGIVLGPLPDDTTLALGMVDLDGLRDPETSALAAIATDIVDRFASYAEASPSQTGAKVFFLCKTADLPKIEKWIGKYKRSILWKRGTHLGIELYFDNRYGTITGQAIDDHSTLIGEPELRIVNFETVRWLVEEAGPGYLADLPQGGLASQDKAGTAARDESGSAEAWRFVLARIEAGDDDEAARAALEADDGPAGEWAARADERQIERSLVRAREHIQKRVGTDDPDIELTNDDVPPFERLDDASRALIGEAASVGGKDSSKIDGRFELDEDGIIRAFTDRHRNDLRFDHTAGKWHYYDGVYWRPEVTRLAHNYAREVSMQLAARDTRAKALRHVRTWEAVERGARPVRAFAVTSETWDRDPLLLGTPGGTVDLRTGELRPARPKDYISRITAAAPVPLDRFDPEQDCPIWLRFLRHALRGDEAAIRFFQQWGGYSLTGETNLQVLAFVYGPGGSGKGTAINTLGDILGGYAVNVGMETLTAAKHDRHTTELARLHGARMARASETEKGRAWAENRIKALTGEDVVTARFMRQDDFEFRPRFKLTVFGNSRPSLRDVDEAIRRRFLILPFDNAPTERDASLGAKLRQEWSGILSWFIEGWLDLQRNGLIRPPVVEAATAEYFAQNDVIGQWLDARCEQGLAYRETTARLWDSWSRFARSEGADPGTKTSTFPETMKQREFEPCKFMGQRGYKGLRLIPQGVDVDLDDLI